MVVATLADKLRLPRAGRVAVLNAPEGYLATLGFTAMTDGMQLDFMQLVGMVEGNGIKIGFGKVEGFRPAQWPDEAGAKRFHLDLQVDDLDEATERLCALGASQPDFQPGAGRWRVLLDPDGQPFCLSPRPVATP